MADRLIPPGYKLCPDCEGWGYTSLGPADNITEYPCYTCNETGLVEDEDYEGEEENENS